MGLMIGVGSTKPTFPYDYYYGIEWDITVSNPKPTRIGKMELHKELPLQNMMRNCILKALHITCTQTILQNATTARRQTLQAHPA